METGTDFIFLGSKITADGDWILVHWFLICQCSLLPCPAWTHLIYPETMETGTDLIFLGSKITADGDSSHEITRCLLLGRKAMTNQDSIWKSRDNTLPTKVRLVKTMVFPVVLYGWESWTIKKLSTKELILLNCGVEKDSWESLGH